MTSDNAEFGDEMRQGIPDEEAEKRRMDAIGHPIFPGEKESKFEKKPLRKRPINGNGQSNRFLKVLD